MDSEVLSRSFLFGTSICVDSINEKLLLRVIESITNSFADFVDVQLLPVNPSPLLQDSILCHHASHEIVLSMAYCERVSTVSTFRWLVMIGVSVSVQLEAAAAGASQSSLITRRVDFARQRSTDSSPNSNRTTRH